MVSLEKYRGKRDSRRTPEPFGGQSTGGQPIFVVQRHDARRLHYDFRLERGGTLASWAVPKGIPLRRGARHLAVHVEDHPLDYATFEGRIPDGQYGAGTVEIWDRGWYELLEEKRDGGLTVRLHGERLDGTWTLVPAQLDGRKENWLLVRKDDDSVAVSYTPMLATHAERLPLADGWVYEPKWDGFRAVATIAAGDATLRSRNDNDLTGRFAALARQLPHGIRTPSAVLDGEICALDTQGRSRFSLLQRSAGRLVYVAFDLLELDGRPTIGLPLTERRELLEEVVLDQADGVVLSPQFEDGAALLRVVRENGLEGVVAKRSTGSYRPGKRVADWVKVKERGRQELVVAGWTEGAGRRAADFGALVLGINESGALRWVGNVGTGFDDAEIRRLGKQLKQLERATSPFRETPRMPRVPTRAVHWVEPVLVAEIEFAEWTHDGRLRAPVYVGLRDDKPASEVRRERAGIPSTIVRGKRTLELSNLEKPFFPEVGLTKGDLLAYYHELAPVVVAHLRDRPFTMKRYPDGWEGKHFFQKNAPSHMPDWIRRAPFPASTRAGERRTIEYPLVGDELALLWMVNMGCIDLHAWASRIDRPERPDWVMFDLDPSPDVGFAEVVEVARLVRQTLELVELECYPKTSGSRGIHVLVPIARRHGWDEVRGFAGIVAAAIARAHPGLATTEWTKAKRKGVLVDANQNGPGRTNAVAYSVRPRAGALVSTPLRWEELDDDLDPGSFTPDAVLDRVAREGDLFAPVLGGRQSLTRALRAVR